MSAHVFHKHRRAARTLLHRKPSNVQVLEERFSPTAIFPGMTEIPDSLPDVLTLIFPDGHKGPGHHAPPAPPATLSTPTALTTVGPPTRAPPTPAPETTSTPTTSATSTSIVTPTTTSTSSAIPTTSSVIRSSSSVIEPATVTLEATESRTFSSSAVPSASSTSVGSSSGVSTGAIVGGVGAGIVAVAAIGFAVAFFIRRVRKREMDEAAGFDARDFRRSAVMLQDPPTHDDTIARGYNPPPPPSMMEQRQQTPVSAPTWGYAESYYGNNVAGYGAYSQYEGQYPSYAPSQVFNSTSPPPTATSAQPLAAASGAYYGQNPISPASSMPSPYEQSVAAPVLTRQASNNSVERQNVTETPEMTRQAADAPYSTLTRQPSMKSTQIPPDDYVDLDRSSVSPFQAAQYAEISRRLNVEPLPGTTSPTLTSPAQLFAAQQKDLPPVPPPVTDHESATSTGPVTSPFNDPEPPTPASASVQSVPPSPRPESKPEPTPVTPPAPLAAPPPVVTITQMPAPPPSPSPPLPSAPNVQTLHVPAMSTDSSQDELEFPIPPSPVISYSSRYRIESLPPTLPEIKVQERSSVSSYIPGSPMIGTGYISGISGISGVSGVGAVGLQPVGPRSEGRFVPASSPLTSSFGAASPDEEREGGFAEAQEKVVKEHVTTTTSMTTAMGGTAGVSTSAAPAAGSSVAASKKEDGKRPDTVYDPDDVYGGI